MIIKWLNTELTWELKGTKKLIEYNGLRGTSSNYIVHSNSVVALSSLYPWSSLVSSICTVPLNSIAPLVSVLLFSNSEGVEDSRNSGTQRNYKAQNM